MIIWLVLTDEANFIRSEFVPETRGSAQFQISRLIFKLFLPSTILLIQVGQSCAIIFLFIIFSHVWYENVLHFAACRILAPLKNEVHSIVDAGEVRREESVSCDLRCQIMLVGHLNVHPLCLSIL